MKNINTDLESIPFSEVRGLKDVETMVWTGLLLKKAELPEVEAFLKEKGLLSAGTLVDAKNISGNVDEDKDHRIDVVLFFKDAVFGNPVVRLFMDGLKWTSDFVVNFRDDYVS